MVDNGGGLPIPGKGSGSAPNEDEQLQKIMRADEEERQRDRAAAQSEKASKRNKIVGGTLLAAVLLGGGGFALTQVNPFGNDEQKVGQTDKKGGADANVDSKNKGTTQLPGENASELNFWQTGGKNTYPFPLDEWQTKPHSDSTSRDKEKMMQKYSGTSLAVASQRLPSGSAGFTSDPSKAKLPDGTLNPMYTTLTAQDYQQVAEGYVERLVNPIYGEWQQYQRKNGKASQNLQLGEFSNMFTQEYLSKNSSKPFKDYIPIYADWNANDYGMGDKLLSNGPRWIGKIDSMNSTFKYDEKTQQYNTDVTANITYSAWAQDQSVLKKNGVLKLKLVTNSNDNNKPKLLISDASLSVS